MKKDKKYVKMSRLCVLLIFIATIIGSLCEVAIVYASVMLHEAAHLFVCKKLKVPTSYIAIYPYGMELKIKRLTTPSEQIKISVAGPLVNIVLFAVGYGIIAPGRDHHLLSFFTSANFILAIFNLLPCLPLDGGEILKSLISKRWGIVNSIKVQSKISAIFNMFFLAAGFLLLYLRLNTSLLVIYLLVQKGLKTTRESRVYALKEILLEQIDSKKRVKKREFSPHTPLKKVINYISFDYTLCAVWNVDGKNCEMMQGEIIKNIGKNPSISLMDCVEKM